MTEILRPIEGPPCRDCPFRRDVQPGVWPDAVYGRLLRYDGNLAQQRAAGAIHPMFCGMRPSGMCGGWLGVFPFRGNLALQFQITGVDIAAVRSYRPGVPLFSSGAEAAAHGRKFRPSSLMSRTGQLPGQDARNDLCYCGHRRFSHNSDSECTFCTSCLMFKLDSPKPQVNADMLADEIAAAVVEWAKADPAKINQAIKYLSVSPTLGPLPEATVNWPRRECQICGECPIYRYDSATYLCKCGHAVSDHPFRTAKEKNARQPQPA